MNNGIFAHNKTINAVFLAMLLTKSVSQLPSYLGILVDICDTFKKQLHARSTLRQHSFEETDYSMIFFDQIDSNALSSCLTKMLQETELIT